jgi:putative lumazine-binding protein
MKAVDINEYKAISDTIQHYLDGARSGKGDDMRPAFHEQATIFGYVGPDLFAGPIEGLYAWHDENGAAVDVVTHVTIMEVVETVAVVRVDADNWTGHRFTDYFTMLKVDGTWKIMNKVFHLHDE